MNENIRDFEQIAVYLARQILIGGGIVSVLIGLCIWLGGLRWIRYAAFIIGLAAGSVLGAIIFGKKPEVITISAAVSGLIAIVFPKPVLIFVGSAIAVTVVLLFFAAPYIQNNTITPPSHNTSGIQEIIALDESIQIFKTQLTYFANVIYNAFEQVSTTGFIVSIIIGLAVLGTGIVSSRIASAASTATTGVIVIFFGMILLLLFKGAMPLSSIYSRTGFFSILAIIMVGMGTFTQLLICPKKKKKNLKSDQIV